MGMEGGRAVGWEGRKHGGMGRLAGVVGEVGSRVQSQRRGSQCGCNRGEGRTDTAALLLLTLMIR